jgi:hypothetical protein
VFKTGLTLGLSPELDWVRDETPKQNRKRRVMHPASVYSYLSCTNSTMCLFSPYFRVGGKALIATECIRPYHRCTYLICTESDGIIAVMLLFASPQISPLRLRSELAEGARLTDYLFSKPHVQAPVTVLGLAEVEITSIPDAICSPNVRDGGLPGRVARRFPPRRERKMPNLSA